MQLIKSEKCKFESNKLIISESIDVNEWKEIGKGLTFINGSVQIWIGDWARFGSKKGWYTDSKAYDEIEQITGYDRATIQDFKYVADKTSSLRNEDKIMYDYHQLKAVAPLTLEKQQIFLNKAVDEKLSYRELREEIKKEERKELKQQPLPDNKYQVIYADPQWAYDDKQDTVMLGGAEKHYPTMPINELCALPVEELSQNNAVLFIWDKIKHNMGHYNSVRHEFLLVATKGSCTPDNIKLYDSVLSIERTEHS